MKSKELTEYKKERRKVHVYVNLDNVSHTNFLRILNCIFQFQFTKCLLFTHQKADPTAERNLFDSFGIFPVNMMFGINIINPAY